MKLLFKQQSLEFILLIIISVVTFRVVEKNVTYPETIKMNDVYYVAFEIILLFAIILLYTLLFSIIGNFRDSDSD